MANDKKPFGAALNPVLGALLEQERLTDEQARMLDTLFADALGELARFGDPDLRRDLLVALEMRHLKIQSLQFELAQEQTRTFSLLRKLTAKFTIPINKPHPITVEYPPRELNAAQKELLDKKISEVFEFDRYNKRIIGSLASMKINTVGELLFCNPITLMKAPNFGKLSYEKLEQALLQRGLRIGQLRNQ